MAGLCARCADGRSSAGKLGGYAAFPLVHPAGKVTCTFVVPCPVVIAPVIRLTSSYIVLLRLMLRSCESHHSGKPHLKQVIVPGTLTTPRINKHLLLVLPQPFTPCTEML
jgi:hypothetical protein